MTPHNKGALVAGRNKRGDASEPEFVTDALQGAGFEVTPVAPPIDPNQEAVVTGAIDPNAEAVSPYGNGRTNGNGNGRQPSVPAKQGESITLRGKVTEAPSKGRMHNEIPVTDFLLYGHQIGRDGERLTPDQEWEIAAWRKDAEIIPDHLVVGDEVVARGKWQPPRQIKRGLVVDNEVSVYTGGISRPLGAEMGDRTVGRNIADSGNSLAA